MGIKKLARIVDKLWDNRNSTPNELSNKCDILVTGLRSFDEVDGIYNAIDCLPYCDRKRDFVYRTFDELVSMGVHLPFHKSDVCRELNISC